MSLRLLWPHYQSGLKIGLLKLREAGEAYAIERINMDLQSLKLAIDTGNPGFYHGNMDDALGELVGELIDVRAELSKASDFDIGSVSELVSLYNGAMDRVAELEGDLEEDTIMEIDLSTCKIVGIECVTDRTKTFENTDEKHPVKIIIKELG